MFRYSIRLAYCGTRFFGWQIQPNEITVQAHIEEQLQRLNSGIPIPIIGCGRTDTGVHASFYIAHFDIATEIDTFAWSYKLNKMLSKDVTVFEIKQVTNDFHARFSATQRTYRYFIHSEKNPFLENSLWHLQELDIEKMNQAAKFLLGKQDFTSLSKLHTDAKTNICTVSEAFWKEENKQLIFQISADRFLRNMVRATVGTLLEVGAGKIAPTEIPSILAAMDRSAAKVSVPAKALFLVDVHY